MAARPFFVINGLKREELIASNSMILHELYFDGLGGEGEPDNDLGARWFAMSAVWNDGKCNFPQWTKPWAADQVGFC